MALNPEDLGSGFRHSKVSMFINEQMAKHDKGPDFYLENLSLTWEEVEDKLKVILEDSTVPIEAREACAWGTLALGVRFAHRQGCLQGHGVQWLQDLSNLHKVATLSLSSGSSQLTHQQEMERKEVALQLQQAQAKLEEVKRERDLLKLKMLQTELRALPGTVRPAMTINPAAFRTGTDTQWSGTKENLAQLMAATTGRKGSTYTTAAALPGKISATERTPEEASGRFMQLLGVVKWKNHPLKRQRVDLRPKCSFSQSLNLKSTASSEPLTIQLPASFTYSYESPFPATPTPPRTPTTERPPQMHAYSMVSDMDIYKGDHQELPKDKRFSAFRRPGDWDCPWCKAVNFSRRENCFHCGKGIWLQNP